MAFHPFASSSNCVNVSLFLSSTSLWFARVRWRIDNGEQLEFLAIFVNIFFLHLCQNIYLYRFQHIHLDFYLCQHLYLHLCQNIYIYSFQLIYLDFYLCQHLYLRPHCLVSRQDRRARRVESNNRERRRMHELNHAFQVRIFLDSDFQVQFFWGPTM